MCFRVDNIPVLQTSRMTNVFKRVDMIIDLRDIEIKSPYYNHKWFRGDISELPTKINTSKVVVNFDGGSCSKGDLCIHYGYHSYLNIMCDNMDYFEKSKITRLITEEAYSYLEVLLRAYIPPNTRYTINTFGHVVSEDIVLTTDMVVLEKYKHTYSLTYIDLVSVLKERSKIFKEEK